MTDATILIIESRHAEIPSFATDLQKKGFDVVTVKSGSDAILHLNKVSPQLVVVNAASLRSSGVRICQSLQDKNEKLPIILILDPELGLWGVSHFYPAGIGRCAHHCYATKPH